MKEKLRFDIGDVETQHPGMEILADQYHTRVDSGQLTFEI
jgi:hypothetical protein